MRRWRTCPQNRNYKISNDGLCKTTHARFDGKYLKPSIRENCAYYVLCEKYYKKAYPIRHLVYTAFVGEVPKGYIVFNKDGNRYNDKLENLDIMPKADKLFYYCPYRTKKTARMTLKNVYTFVINGKKYNTSMEVIKEYHNLGSRQNLCFQADRWIEGRAARGKTWNPEGFIIGGTLIWATKKPTKNPVKKRMDKIKQEHKL